MECYARKTATFLLLGPVCTRNCRFCGVSGGRPKPVDEGEPERIAQAVRTLGLSHVVLTCVSRDDLPDGGADHFCRCLDAIRSCQSDLPLEERSTIEVLPSDFAGNGASVDRLADALPDVYNYNTETVPRLFREIRGPIPNFEWTLDTFRRIRVRQPSVALKSGMMLGLGETDEEVLEVLHRLYEAGCDAITLGQYLQPTPENIPVSRYLTPEHFEQLGEKARAIGFRSVASAPFVRSSYRAATFDKMPLPVVSSTVEESDRA